MVITIMNGLLNDEQIMKTYAKDIEKETERKTAEKMKFLLAIVTTASDCRQSWCWGGGCKKPCVYGK